ncbi:MAG TPA: diacylglycerol kinase family protein [Egibacteraceae bacterium]|nr:diacylglycerol kinase family protein [Egibacteraceae bacterium]
MSSAFGPLRLIVNPRAGNGAVNRALPALADALRRRDLEHEIVLTTGRGHATEAARAALKNGIRFLVAVGGDGTVQEVVNGMFADGQATAEDAVLGVVDAGSGADFVRTFGLDRSPEVLARHFATDALMPIDIGRVRFVDAQGEPAERLFVNIAEVGYGAEVVRLAERLPRWMGRLRYLFAAWGAIAALDRAETTVSVAHTEMRTAVTDLVVANCQFFGGGMKAAPRALPDDGLYNVLVFTGPRSQVFNLTMKLFRGEHLPHPQISEYQSPTVSYDSGPPARVEADGELLGFTPASFDLLPKALRLKI